MYLVDSCGRLVDSESCPVDSEGYIVDSEGVTKVFNTVFHVLKS